MRIHPSIPVFAALLALFAFSAGCGGGDENGTTTAAGSPAAEADGTGADSPAQTDGENASGEKGSTAEGGGGASDKGSARGSNTSGGGNKAGNSGEAGGGNAKSTAQEEFINEANALCNKASAQFEKELQPYIQKGLKAIAEDSTTIVEDLVVPGIEAEIDELRALGPPPEDRAEVEAIFAALEDAAEQAESDPEGFVGEETGGYAESERLAEAYGIDACGAL